MATGRTLNRWTRLYISGGAVYSVMGTYSRSVGSLVWDYPAADLTAPMGDSVVGVLPDTPNITMGPLNLVYDNTASIGVQASLGGAGVSRIISVPIGIRAAPAEGDPVFCGAFLQKNYMAVENGGAMTATVDLQGWDATALINYTKPWGVLLHPRSTVTGANTSAGVDDRGAQTTAGGFMVYHVTAGNGTGTISIDDSADNSSWTPLSGATSGEVNLAAAPSGIVALGIGATVRQYLRWQIAFNTATSCAFVLSFVRI